jgi:ferredoxin-nitrite reductase
MIKKLHEAQLARSGKINKIEKIKQDHAPQEIWDRIEAYAKSGYESITKEDKEVLLKYFGIFDKKEPNSFMLRVRIPAGQLSAAQALVIGQIAQQYGQDYIDITTRMQVELRYLKIEEIPTILTMLKEVGISTYQTGIDNFRNIVTSPLDGLSQQSKITAYPLIKTLQSIFLEKEEWIGVLPRKFNTAILGNETNDCNIYGHDCSFVLAQKEETLGFNLYLGGKVGVQAKESGVFVAPDEVKDVYRGIIELFKTYGYRDNRNKNRLHFLIEDVGMTTFVEALQEHLGQPLQESGKLLVNEEFLMGSDGVVALNNGLFAQHISIPTGIFSGSALIDVAQLAKEYEGAIRLSVEQSLYIVNVSTSALETLHKSDLFKQYEVYQSPYFQHLIACAGSQTCKFGVIENKPDAIAMAHYLSKEVPLDSGNVRMYWSACPKGCGIHGVGDIGFEGCKAKDSEGNSVDGVHIFVGGKASHEAKEARVLFKSVPLLEAPQKVAKLMEIYRTSKLPHESFEMFDTRVFQTMSVEEITSLLGA